MLLKDKVAVVTGGTRGIGYAIVKKYLENGAKVVLFAFYQPINPLVMGIKIPKPVRTYLKCPIREIHHPKHHNRQEKPVFPK